MKKFIDTLLGLLVVIALVLDITYFVIQSKKDSTFIERVLHMNQLTQAPQDEDAKPAPFIFEFKYEANKDGKGLEVFEILVTTYTGINMNDTYGYGVQIINPSQMSLDVKVGKVDETFASWHTETITTMLWILEMQKSIITTLMILYHTEQQQH